MAGTVKKIVEVIILVGPVVIEVIDKLSNKK